MSATAGRLLLVNYHYIRDPGQYLHPGIHPISPDDFKAEIGGLNERFHLATPEEAEAYLTGHGELPGDTILITFDDGLVDHRDIARDFLDPLGLKAVFFVSSQPLQTGRAVMVHKIHWLRATTEPEEFRLEFLAALPPGAQTELDHETSAEAGRVYIYDPPEIGQLKYLINFRLPYDVVDETASAMLGQRGIDEAEFCRGLYMNEDEIRSLAANGHLIGCHGTSHKPFTTLAPGDDLEGDAMGNRRHLGGILGRRPAWVSYPYGRGTAIPDDTADFCRRFGFTLGLTLDNGWNESAAGIELSRVKRINTNELSQFVKP